MNGRRYRIKLYGHTSSEPQKFLKNLAAFLGTDEQGAQALLEQAPVVIKEGLDKERANVLQEALSLMRALSILEPMEGQDEGDQARLAAVDRILDSYRARAEETSEPWFSRRWVLGAIAAGIIVLCLMGVAIVPGLRKTAQPAPVQSPPGAGASQPDAGQWHDPYKDWSLDELAAERDALDRTVEDLQARWSEAFQTLTTLQNTPGTNPATIAEKKREVAQMRSTLRESRQEKTIIERRLRALERSRGPALPAPLPPGDE